MMRQPRLPQVVLRGFAGKIRLGQGDAHSEQLPRPLRRPAGVGLEVPVPAVVPVEQGTAGQQVPSHLVPTVQPLLQPLEKGSHRLLAGVGLSGKVGKVLH